MRDLEKSGTPALPSGVEDASDFPAPIQGAIPNPAHTQGGASLALGCIALPLRGRS